MNQSGIFWARTNKVICYIGPSPPPERETATYDDKNLSSLLPPNFPCFPFTKRFLAPLASYENLPFCMIPGSKCLWLLDEMLPHSWTASRSRLYLRIYLVEVCLFTWLLPWANNSSPSCISSRKNFWTASASLRSGNCLEVKHLIIDNMTLSIHRKPCR